MTRQCSSCGGFCKKSGCERENVKPKEWQGLTDEEREEATGWSVEHIEAKLKEKNT